MTTAPATTKTPKDRAWHSQSADAVLTTLASAATGLSAQEAALRLATNGPNELKEGKRISPLQIFLGHPVGWRHDRECARDNFHRALPVLRRGGEEMEAAQGAKQSHGHLRKLGGKFRIDEKDIAGEEHDVYDASNENLPVGSDSRIF